MSDIGSTTGQKITHMLIVILSCAFISFYQGGIWLLIPPLNGTIAFGISLLLVFLVLTSQNNRNYLCFDMKVYGIASFMLLSLVYMLLSHEQFTKSGFLVSFYCFVMMCIGAYIHDKEKERKIILLYILAEVILKEICDIYELTKNPMIIRDSGFDVLSVNGSGIEKLVNIPSIYTFAVIYFIVLCNFKRSKHKILSIAYMALTLYVLYSAQMSLPLLLTIIITLYILVVKTVDIKKIILFSAVFCLFFMILLPTGLNWILKNNFFPIEVTKRLQDVYDIFFKDASFADIINEYGSGLEKDYTSTQGRITHYIESFRAMGHNFFLGELTPNKFKNGGHSTWIDYIAKFGFTILIYYFSLIRHTKAQFKKSEYEGKKVLIAVSIFYLISGILNSFQIVLFTMHMFILVPYFYELLIDNNFTIKWRPLVR
ncbi:MAG TPA: hypothetical protein DCY31_00820 [Ruminococcaceae bacterium]|nr:hypothetical protein [Oscillospiraceae bacterium]